MHLVIQRVVNRDDIAFYLIQKLQVFTGAPPLVVQTIALGWLADLRDGPIVVPLAAPQATPRYSPLHLAYAKGLARERCPLAPGEAWIESSAKLSYLTEEYAGHPAGTIALQIETTQAAFVFLFLGSYYKDGKIYRYRHAPDRLADEDVATEPSPYMPPALPEVPQVRAGPLTWGALAASLATGIASGIGNKIGTAIFDSVFGGVSNLPSWYGKAYEDFTNLIREAFDNAWKTKIESGLKGVQSKINQYNTVKQRFMLEDAWKQVTELCAELVNFGKTGLANFTIGGGLHLLTLQEFALITTGDEKKGWLDLIGKQALEYADVAERFRKALYDERMGKISAVTSYRGPDNRLYYTWSDKGLDGKKDFTYTDSCGTSGSQKAHDERNKHHQKVNQSTLDLLAPVLAVVEDWKKLKDQPLPPARP